MSIESHDLRTVPVRSDDAYGAGLYDQVRHRASEPWTRDNFSTALFTGLNIGVFLVLAASVLGAAILYGQGA
jgi:hypothetical protein